MSLSLHHVKNPLAKMEQAPFEFHLTGSRFFDLASPNSDWDFFVEFQSELPDWLAANGFCKESESDYTSRGIAEVWLHESGRVHIQVIEDVLLKTAIQDAMRSHGYGYMLYQMSKDQRKTFWNFAFDLFEAGEEQGVRASQPTA